MSEHKMDSREFFDKKAKDWDKEKIRVSIASTGAKTMLDAYKDWKGNERVLDFGCGTGVVSFILAPHAGKVVGVDVSSGMIDTFNEKAKEKEMQDKVIGIQEDLTPTEWEPQADELKQSEFDIMVSSLTLHHIQDPKMIVKRLSSMLKPNGTMMIMDIEKTEHSNEFHPKHIAKDAGVHHQGGFSRSAMQSMFEDSGLKDVEFHVFEHERPVHGGEDNNSNDKPEMKKFNFLVSCAKKK